VPLLAPATVIGGEDMSNAKRKRYTRVVGYCLAGALLAVLALGSGLWAWTKPIRDYDRGFDAIARGMSAAEVTQIMGEPRRIRSGQDVIMARSTWDDVADEPSSSVHLEYGYHAETFYLPVDWLVGFNEEGAVVSKHRLD